MKGDQIPLLARVIAVADTFDALTTNRPYQQAHNPDEALKIIQNLAGKRLDPEAVAALLAVYARGEIRIQRISDQAARACGPSSSPRLSMPATSAVSADERSNPRKNVAT